MRKWTVGQTVCLVTYGYRHNAPPEVENVPVEKIGRKWGTVRKNHWNETRFDLESGVVDGGRGAVFETESEYRAMIERQSAWKGLHDAMNKARWSEAPKHLTTEQITAVHAILFPQEARDDG